MHAAYEARNTSDLIKHTELQNSINLKQGSVFDGFGIAANARSKLTLVRPERAKASLSRVLTSSALAQLEEVFSGLVRLLRHEHNHRFPELRTPPSCRAASAQSLTVCALHN